MSNQTFDQWMNKVDWILLLTVKLAVVNLHHTYDFKGAYEEDVSPKQAAIEAAFDVSIELFE